MMGKCKCVYCVLLKFSNRLLFLLHFELKRKIKKTKALINHSYAGVTLENLLYIFFGSHSASIKIINAIKLKINVMI